ncbi:hypothetical protein [uncultured Flavobacterium sp.]|uniref:hypothetical protein n=1 Tax=uncultured Flavobacterium sp. TaxID=165435 RepID=UPI0030ED41B8|tara:strand:+ start:1799 stop:3307 length:1509 start_codon:yes stop_codon:yes gene_type:complete
MKEQKNIERLFQEKFKDFEVAPPEMAWNNIEARLNEKKKKRRVIPFWFKISGIAASLFLGFYIYSLFNSLTIEKKIDQNSIVVEEKNNSIQNQNGLNTIEPNQNSKNSLDKQNSILTEIDNSDNLVNKINTDKNTIKKERDNILKPTENLLSFSKKNKKEKTNIKSNQENQNTKGFSKLNLIESDSEKIEMNTNSNLVKNEIDFDKINTINKDKNSSIVAEKKANNTTQDSSLVAKISAEVNALEQLLKEKEVGKNVEEKEKEMRNRWAVSSNASPVYFNSSTNGSPLDAKFESNEKSYNNKLSVGVGLSYAINDKISLRTGLNTVNLNYNTKGVVFFQDANAREIQNVSKNQRGSLINIENKSTEINSSVEINQFGNDVKKYDGELNQQMGYIELPFELSYKILDKKFGVNFVGGMSTLFLNKNNVSLVSNGMDIEIGEANNLNKVHFSSNVGLSFKYSFFNSFDINFNPMFKYQHNTYTDNSGNFKPYFIGLYSGLSYKF